MFGVITNNIVSFGFFKSFPNDANRKKSRILETLNLSPSADSSTNTKTIFLNISFGIFFFKFLFCFVWVGGFLVPEFQSFWVWNLPSFQWGPMRGLATDHVILGPIRGLEKSAPGCSNGPGGHGDCMTESARWGWFSEKQNPILSQVVHIPAQQAIATKSLYYCYPKSKTFGFSFELK